MSLLTTQAFGTLKQAVRQETQKSGGVRYNPENPSGGFENAQRC